MSDSVCSMGMYVGGFHMMDTYTYKKMVHKNCLRINQTDLPSSTLALFSIKKNKDSFRNLFSVLIGPTFKL